MSNHSRFTAMVVIDRLVRVFVILIALVVLFSLMLHAEIWIDIGIASYWECTTVFFMALIMLVSSVVAMVIDYAG